MDDAKNRFLSENAETGQYRTTGGTFYNYQSFREDKVMSFGHCRDEFVKGNTANFCPNFVSRTTTNRFASIYFKNSQVPAELKAGSDAILTYTITPQGKEVVRLAAKPAK